MTVTGTVTYNCFMDRFSVFAPGKVNLHLAVKDKRPDGFHNLESVFLAVDFGDTLFFSSVPVGEDSLIMEPSDIDSSVPNSSIPNSSVPNNIILRALSLFREKTDFQQNLSIYVVKRIPIGGGLGGGSSDAASTLLALNKIAGFPLGTEQLLETGAALGSDVPFFLRQIPAAWVTGRGEYIEPLEMSKIHLVLVNPGFPSDTAAAFKLLDENRYSQGTHAEACLTTREWLGARRKESSSFTTPPRLCENAFYNDFLPVFDDQTKTIYNKIISQLFELGAQYANLSGSGSTCFGVFEKKEQAQRAAEILKNDWGFVKAADTITAASSVPN